MSCDLVVNYNYPVCVHVRVLCRQVHPPPHIQNLHTENIHSGFGAD